MPTYSWSHGLVFSHKFTDIEIYISCIKLLINTMCCCCMVENRVKNMRRFPRLPACKQKFEKKIIFIKFENCDLVQLVFSNLHKLANAGLRRDVRNRGILNHLFAILMNSVCPTDHN